VTATAGSSRVLALGVAALSFWFLRCAPEDVVVFEVPALQPIGGSASGGGASGGPSAGAGTANGGSAGSTNGGSAGSTNGGSAGIANGGSAGSANGGSAGTANGGSAGSANGGSAGSMPCRDDADCPDSRECQKNSCADATGQCEPRPVFCELAPKPVCGCDQVTYWNECVRRQGGAVAGTPGECRANARECASAADCGVEGASCPRLYSPPEEPCTSPPEARRGICWVVPLDCESGDPRRWSECQSGPPPGPPPLCVDTCEALRSDGSYLVTPLSVCE
jgi:hypothetical protein